MDFDDWRDADRRMADAKQVDISKASFRIMHTTPGHVTYGFWVNGGKCGDLIVRLEERIAFEEMMVRGGFKLTHMS